MKIRSRIWSVVVLALAVNFGFAQTKSGGKSLGIDVSGMDRTARPQDDFFRFVNGAWFEKTAIPADSASYGSFAILRDKSQDALKEIIEQSAAQKNAPRGSNAQKVGDLYTSFMDTVRI